MLERLNAKEKDAFSIAMIIMTQERSKNKTMGFAVLMASTNTTPMISQKWKISIIISPAFFRTKE
jgi:hypothetical protein